MTNFTEERLVQTGAIATRVSRFLPLIFLACVSAAGACSPDTEEGQATGDAAAHFDAAPADGPTHTLPYGPEHYCASSYDAQVAADVVAPSK